MSDSVFTAGQIAGVLQRPKQSVLESLRRTPPSGMKIVHGNKARAWSKEALPQGLQKAIEDVAARRKTSVDALLASPPQFWRPRDPLSQLCEKAIERASLLKRALPPPLLPVTDVGPTSTELM